MSRIAAVSGAALLLIGLVANDIRADYTDSCTNSRLVMGTWLSADCKMRNGGTHYGAMLNLNDVIANDDGFLKWRRGGNFAATCNHIYIIAPDIGRLGAFCRPKRGGARPAFVNLGARIDNMDGELRYQPGHDDL